MACGHTLSCATRFHPLTISLLFLSISLTAQLRFFASGRTLVKPVNHSQVKMKVTEEKILRGQIGSRPPRCERRCGSCGHCEAIQVPTTPRVNNSTDLKTPAPAAAATIAYARGDYSSNYKPMSWKCKCGSFIFNP